MKHINLNELAFGLMNMLLVLMGMILCLVFLNAYNKELENYLNSLPVQKESK